MLPLPLCRWRLLLPAGVPTNATTRFFLRSDFLPRPEELSPDVIFTAISLFSLLNVPMQNIPTYMNNLFSANITIARFIACSFICLSLHALIVAPANNRLAMLWPRHPSVSQRAPPRIVRSTNHFRLRCITAVTLLSVVVWAVARARCCRSSRANALSGHHLLAQ